MPPYGGTTGRSHACDGHGALVRLGSCGDLVRHQHRRLSLAGARPCGSTAGAGTIRLAVQLHPRHPCLERQVLPLLPGLQCDHSGRRYVSRDHCRGGFAGRSLSRTGPACHRTRRPGGLGLRLCPRSLSARLQGQDLSVLQGLAREKTGRRQSDPRAGGRCCRCSHRAFHQIAPESGPELRTRSLCVALSRRGRGAGQPGRPGEKHHSVRTGRRQFRSKGPAPDASHRAGSVHCRRLSQQRRWPGDRLGAVSHQSGRRRSDERIDPGALRL